MDRSSDKVVAKIRNARMELIPNMAILGHKEVEDGTVSVRIRGEESPITKTTDQFIDDRSVHRRPISSSTTSSRKSQIRSL